MKHQKWLVFVVALGLMAGTAGGLAGVRGDQKHGNARIKAMAIPGSVMMKIELPERVLDFTSTNMPEPEVVVGYLPKDTSYAGRLYTATNGLQINSTII